ncbi:MAG: HDOD domain-containing protein [Nitrospirae bacterium]|nr:HDOD domain-containing protein [Nitrospirota bacterium]
MPETEGNTESIKDLVLIRLREYSDFPAMSNTIMIINRFTTSGDASISEFANIVLRDYALTSKVLKIVNSVNYAQFGEVSTISRAITLLGIENIKNLAITLMFFDHFRENSVTVDHIDSILRSLFSGILARKIAAIVNVANMEEAYICSLFHNFGKVLVAFALPEKIVEIKRLSHEQGISEYDAAVSLLGGSYEEMGMAIARGWNFPEKIVRSMHKLDGIEIGADDSEIDKLNGIASFANEVADILSSGSEKKEMEVNIENLVTKFKSRFGMLYGSMEEIINSSFDTLKEFSGLFNVGLFDAVPFNRKFMTWAEKAEKGVATSEETWTEGFNTDLIKTIDFIFESGKMNSPDSIFAKGIQDVNNAILGDFSLNDIMRIVLETIYRGMQLSKEGRTLFLIKDTKLPVMSIRFGFGSGIEELKKWFNIRLGGSNDIFNVAIARQTDFVIEDTEPPDIRKLLPEWFKSRVFERIFIVLLPIIINTKPIGMFYVEGDREGFRKISGSHLNYLKILRDQTVMAVKHKHWD